MNSTVIECLLRQIAESINNLSGGGGGGGGGTMIAPPFVHSDDGVPGDYSGELLDDPRGVAGDWLYDPTRPDYFYRKVDATPDTWVVVTVGTVDA